MVLIETAVFTRNLLRLATDDEYRAFQADLIERPDMGALIRGAAGARKVRMAIRGQGKSGGARVIYYVVDGVAIYLLMIYAKSETEDLDDEQVKKLAVFIRKELK